MGDACGHLMGLWDFVVKFLRSNNTECGVIVQNNRLQCGFSCTIDSAVFFYLKVVL